MACGVVKLIYLDHYDEIIGNDTKRTILFTTPNNNSKIKKMKGIEKTYDWFELMLRDTILLKMIITNNTNVTFLLKYYNNQFSDITEKNMMEINKINLNEIDYSFALELFTYNLLFLGNSMLPNEYITRPPKDPE